MPFQVSPGVNFTENDYGLTVNGLSTSIGGYAGVFSWGPVDQVVSVAGEPEIARRFGRPNDNNFKYFFVASNYLAYTSHLKLVRVIAAGEKNAASGGQGTGFKVDVNATDGSISSASLSAAGTGYVAGDVVLIPSAVTPAKIRITKIGNNGAVQAFTLLNGGEGHNDATAVATVTLDNVLVKNDDDIENDIFLPEVVARYPSALGNSLLFSAVRASEFDNWAYKGRFVVAPDANVISYDTNGVQTVFALPAGKTTLPADAIVTVAGFRILEGVDPGSYSISNGNIVIHEDSELFTADGKTSTYTLNNVHDLDTTNARVQINSTSLTRYTGVGPVPFGSFRADVGKIVLGVNSKRFSGNGTTLTFTLTGVASTPGAKVFVGSTAYTVVSTVPNAGEVRVATASGNTTITFATGQAPAIGSQNIEIRWGYPALNASIQVSYGAPVAASANLKIFSNQTEVHAVVVDVDGAFSGEKYALLERFDFMSLSPSGKASDGTSSYYFNVINKTSQFVRLGSELFAFEDKRLTGGVTVDSSEKITSSVLRRGYEKFVNAEEVDVAHVIGGDAPADLAQWLIGSLSEFRKDCVVYLSPPQSAAVANSGNEADDIVAFRRNLPSSSYGTMDPAWKMISDPYNDKFRWIPLAGDHAGIYASTHETFDPWLSGAGANRGRIKNCVKLSWIPNKNDRDTLYKNGINPVANFTDTGPIIYGDKTLLSKPSPFDRMNVRWLFIVLEQSITRSAKFYLFEFNDEFTRNQFKNTVHPFLRDVQGRRGITDFRIVCDDKNNGGGVIDRNEFIGDIYIKPARSINFIQLNFNAVGTDVSFEEIINSQI